MSFKVTVRQRKIRGRKMFAVRHRVEGRVRHNFFDSKFKADAFAMSRRGLALAADQQFFLLPQPERDKLLMARTLALERGLDLLSVITNAVAVAGSPAAKTVLDEMLLAKTAAGRDKDYTTSLKSVVKMFLRGRGSRRVNDFNLTDVEEFLGSKNLASRPTLRSRLATFFKFAMRRKYRMDNPCAALEHVKVLAAPPQIFTPEQVEACLKWFVSDGGRHTSGLPWFLLTTFCGLRPEEAMLCAPKNLSLDADKPFVEVTADICKTGQWRIVYPPAEVMAALKKSLKLAERERAKMRLENPAAVPAPPLPLGAKRKTKLQKRLREVLGLKVWPHDVTRHSASSYWLAVTNDARHVAEMLGHSESVARRKYKKPVERATAEKFYAALNLIR